MDKLNHLKKREQELKQIKEQCLNTKENDPYSLAILKTMLDVAVILLDCEIDRNKEEIGNLLFIRKHSDPNWGKSSDEIEKINTVVCKQCQDSGKIEDRVDGEIT